MVIIVVTTIAFIILLIVVVYFYQRYHRLCLLQSDQHPKLYNIRHRHYLLNVENSVNRTTCIRAYCVDRECTYT